MKDNKTIEITTYIGCSNMCEYCPQILLINRYKNQREDKENKPQTVLTLKNFKKYIETIPSDIDFHFTGYVEPFDCPECDELLLLSHQEGHKIQINTTLEGLTYDKYVIKSNPQNLGLHSHGGTHCQALEILKELNVDGLLPHSGSSPTSTRSQNVEKVLDPKSAPYKVQKSKIPAPWNIRGKCSRIYQPVLTPDGRLGLCCQDYGLDEVAGNLSRQTWDEYRESEKFKELEKNGAEMCDYCDIGINTYI